MVTGGAFRDRPEQALRNSSRRRANTSGSALAAPPGRPALALTLERARQPAVSHYITGPPAQSIILAHADRRQCRRAPEPQDVLGQPADPGPARVRGSCGRPARRTGGAPAAATRSAGPPRRTRAPAAQRAGR